MLRDNLVGLIEPMLSGAGAYPLALRTNRKQSSDDRPACLENPRPAGAESTLTENVASPFHAEPGQALVLRSYELKFDPPEPREFEHQMREQEAGRLANDLRDLAYLIQSFKVKDGDSADVVAYDVLKFANDIHGAWISGFNDTVLHGISRRRSEKRAGLRRRSTWERHPTCENYQRSYLTGVRRSSRNFENISLHLMNSTEQSSPTRFILSNRRSCRIST